jgi:serpin B
MTKKLLALALAALLGACPLALPGAAAPEDDGYTAFSLHLLNAYLTSGEADIALSPASAYLALAMAMRGADGETLAQFEDVLGVSSDDLLASAEKISGMIAADAREGVRLILANSLWMDDATIVPNGEFLSELSDAFSAQINRLDLQADGVADQINQWVDEKTEGFIPHLIDKIDKADVLLLINTLFMDAKWQTAFPQDNTGERNFTRADGTVKKTDFMSRWDAYLPYLETETYEAVVLAYRGETLALVAIRPLGGERTGFEITGDMLAGALRADISLIDLSLPKFKKRFRTDMEDALQKLGLTDAFSQAARFPRFGESSAPLGLSKVIQEVLLRVDETGTQAAAATLVGIEAKSAFNDDPPKIVEFNTPFIYAIVDTKTAAPLFFGTYDEP